MIAALEPTYVHGMLEIDKGFNITAPDLQGYISVRKDIIELAPTCKFGITVDALHFDSVRTGTGGSDFFQKYHYYSCD